MGIYIMTSRYKTRLTPMHINDNLKENNVPAYGSGRDMMNGFRRVVEEKAGVKYPEFIPLKYTQQLMGEATDFHIKFQVGDKKYIHAGIVHPMPYTRRPDQCYTVEEAAFDDNLISKEPVPNQVRYGTKWSLK